ncbi:PREDICTED: uncharacterized protein LOC108355528, partial [Rhagoletis zephyria]|uniref:uncharacterized protein LOC108355528 n=1 Tax=Rhagoletis zephyria TaxID=28612 RepID=UPI00081162F7
MVAEALNAISVGEVLNPSLKKTTAEMARSMRSIQDHRDSEVLYFEDKLLPALSAFGTSLHKQRDEIRSTTNKVFDGKGSDGSRSRWSTAAAGASSTASRSSSTRRSQSVERVEKPSKEERALQQMAQRYELRRNLVLRKVLLKLILSELRYTIRAFNSLTDVYKAVSRGFSPLDDLKLFNEFFHFRSLNRAILNEVEGDVSDVESAEEEEEDDEDSDTEEEEAEDSDNEEEEESEESGLEEDDTEGDMASETLDGRRSALKKGGGDE